jgi:uncharacterized protein (DUF1778 family)
MSKSARIELRADPEDEERISRAARLVNQSKTAFIMAAAIEKADEVMATWTTTVVSPEFFDQLVDAFDQPVRPNEALAEAVKRRNAALATVVA